MKTLEQHLEELAPLDSERAELEKAIIRAGGEPPKMASREFSFSDPPPTGCVSWATYKADYEAHVAKLREKTGKSSGHTSAPSHPGTVSTLKGGKTSTQALLESKGVKTLAELAGSGKSNPRNYSLPKK